jgi:hypothetical protein
LLLARPGSIVIAIVVTFIFVVIVAVVIITVVMTAVIAATGVTNCCRWWRPSKLSWSYLQ